MAKYHRNDKRNMEPHHLYEIIDIEEDEVFKYGISADPIGKDGLSERVREQLSLYNIVANTLRFFGRILIRNIKGNTAARRLEKKHITQYEQEHGKRPRGNREQR